MALYSLQNLTPPSGWQLQAVPECESTNTLLFHLAAEGAPTGRVLLAHHQTGGKGSRGRAFFSPEGGIYLSVLLRDIPAAQLCRLTPLAAVAVYKALRPHTDKSLAIKWVNDIYLEGRKVCGILTENRFVGGASITVVGVGINIVPPESGYPTDFMHPAAALLNTPDAVIAEDIINTFLAVFYDGVHDLADGRFMAEYKKNCCTLGKQVTLKRGEDIMIGKAVDITENGALILETDEGREILSSGEVTSQTSL